MVVLLDWDKKKVFGEEKVVKGVKHTLFKDVDEVVEFKWFVKKEECDESSVVFFRIKPVCNAFEFDEKMDLSNEEVFHLKLDTSGLPDCWKGELLVENEGVVFKIGLEFEKKSVIH